jgi:glycosyltransferase involved in cell wall biosynthesis
VPISHTAIMQKRLRVLVTSYACAPDSGSEPGNGWNWPKYLALAGCAVTVITSPQWRDAIESELAQHPINGFDVRYVQPPNWPMLLGWQVGSKAQYIIWLWRAASLGKRLHSSAPYSICHHVSWGSLAAGSFMWRFSAPLVMGPVGGGQTSPAAFKSYFGRDWRGEAVRSFFVRHLVPLSPLARKAARSASLVMVSNRESEALAKSLGAQRVVIIAPDSGLPEDYGPTSFPVRELHRGLKMVWVGRIFSLRGLPLALDALRQAAGASISLEIFGGGGHEAEVPGWIAERELQDRASYYGHVDWPTLRAHYEGADAFLFTSVRDSCAAQLLEAMAWGLPIITLDHHGASCAVPNAAGIKVPVTTIDETVAGLAAAMLRLAAHPDVRSQMGEAGYLHAQSFTWSKIAGRAVCSYEALLETARVGRGDSDRQRAESQSIVDGSAHIDES